MMRFSPILLFHICCGTMSVLAGFAAISVRKGSHRHRVVGNVFFISMLGLGLSGAYMGLLKSQVTNVLGGVLTCYLVATAWATARRREGEPGVFDWIALLVALAVGTTEVIFGLQAAHSPTGLKYGYPVWPYAMFALVALLAAVGDVRMLVHRGVSGTPRLVRHLWRMCFAFFIASASIFLARPHLFPALLRKNVIPFLGVLPLILMLFWLVRVRFANADKKKSIPRTGAVSSVRI
jgi:hypothetical protein